MKLTAADAALMAIPRTENMPAAEVAELLVIETVGALPIPLSGGQFRSTGTAVGDVFVNGIPGW